MNSNLGAITREFRQNQYLFREGDPSRAMYLIKKGSVSIRKRRGSGYVEVARIYANEVIGEISFFDRLPRSASAVALTQCEVLELPFESLDKIYTNVPDYFKTIIAGVAERLRRANDTIRRLQKQIISEGHTDDESSSQEEEIDAATVLAATAGIGITQEEDKKNKKKSAA